MDIIYPVSALDKVHEQDLGRDKANPDLIRDECETNHNKLSNNFNEDKVFQQQSSAFTSSATDNTVRAVQISFCGYGCSVSQLRASISRLLHLTCLTLCFFLFFYFFN